MFILSENSSTNVPTRAAHLPSSTTVSWPFTLGNYHKCYEGSFINDVIQFGVVIVGHKYKGLGHVTEGVKKIPNLCDVIY